MQPVLDRLIFCYTAAIFLSARAPVIPEKSRILAQSPSANDRTGRHRRIAGALAVVSAFGVVTAFAVAPTSRDDERVALERVVERLATPAVAVLPEPGLGYLREEHVQRGDTLASLLSRLGVQDREAFDFLRTNSSAQAIARQLRPGKALTARTTEDGQLLSLHFPLSGKDAVLVVTREATGLQIQEQAYALETRTEFRSGEIRYSLFGATDAAGIPDSIATQLADIFGGDIDFYRDLRKGDRFSVVYEMLYQRGQPHRSGRILAAEFTNDGNTYQAYWYRGDSNQVGGYYTADGKNLRKAFLRSPLEFSRVTSGFTGSRFHPVLKTWRAHKGVDYGAPIGTRVRSVADGTVEFAGQQGGYGNIVVLRHHGAYSTAYGHLNGFAAGIRRGTRVAQGDIIGYVGRTGLASGPHLHYEFRVNNQQVNPLTVTMPSAPPLAAADIGKFSSVAATLRQQLQLSKESPTLVAVME